LETPNFVERLMPNGNLDPTFGRAGVVNGSGSGIGFQSTGKIVVSGFDGAALARLNTNGSVDTTFGANGLYTDNRIRGSDAMVMQPNDEILCTGLANAYSQFVVTQVLADGSSYDPTIGTNGLSASLSGNSAGSASIALDSSGRILVTGSDFYIPGNRGFATARFVGDSTSTPTIRIAPANRPPAPAAAPDVVLGALALNDATSLDSLPSGKHRRLN
jgi:uncharacterized delta-60 repeat protein